MFDKFPPFFAPQILEIRNKVRRKQQFGPWIQGHATTWLGAMAFADVFPMIVLSVFAGAISDRIGYARVIKAMQLGYVLVGVGFTLLIFFDAITIWLVLALTICHGIIEAMSTPPRLALVNALVDRKDLSAAVALNSATSSRSNASDRLFPVTIRQSFSIMTMGVFEETDDLAESSAPTTRDDLDDVEVGPGKMSRTHPPPPKTPATNPPESGDLGISSSKFPLYT